MFLTGISGALCGVIVGDFIYPFLGAALIEYGYVGDPIYWFIFSGVMGTLVMWSVLLMTYDKFPMG